MSATVRVSTPSIPSEESPSSGAAEIRPRAGFRPTSPQQAAGIRIEPPPSLPCATGTIPDATAAAAAAGRAAGGALQIPRVARRTEEPRLADRQDPVLGQRRRAHDHEPRLAQAPHDVVVVGRDEVFHQRAAVGEPQAFNARLFLIAIGTPANGRSSPGSTSSAAASARSASTSTNAFSCGLSSSIRAKRDLDQLARGDLSGAHHARELARGTEHQIAVGHWLLL